MTCTDCKGRRVQGKLFCNDCMPDETGWLVPVQEVPDPFFMDRNHAYITPDNKVWVLDHTRMKAIEYGKDNSFDISQFARKDELIRYVAGEGIAIDGTTIKSTVNLAPLTQRVDDLDTSVTNIGENTRNNTNRIELLERKPDKDTTYKPGTNITIDGSNVISANIDLTPILDRLSANDTTDAEQQELLEQLRNSISEIKYVGGEGITVSEGGIINGVTHNAEVTGGEANLYIISPDGKISSLTFQGFTVNLMEQGRVRITPKPDRSWETRVNELAEITNERANTLEQAITAVSTELNSTQQTVETLRSLIPKAGRGITVSGDGTWSVEQQAITVSGAGLATVTKSGSNYQVNVPEETITGRGGITVTKSGRNYTLTGPTIPQPTVTNITGEGGTTVTRNGTTFVIRSPQMENLTFNSGTGIRVTKSGSSVTIASTAKTRTISKVGNGLGKVTARSLSTSDETLIDFPNITATSPNITIRKNTDANAYEISARQKYTKIHGPISSHNRATFTVKDINKAFLKLSFMTYSSGTEASLKEWLIGSLEVPLIDLRSIVNAKGLPFNLSVPATGAYRDGRPLTASVGVTITELEIGSSGSILFNTNRGNAVFVNNFGTGGFAYNPDGTSNYVRPLGNATLPIRAYIVEHEWEDNL